MVFWECLSLQFGYSLASPILENYAKEAKEADFTGRIWQ